MHQVLNSSESSQVRRDVIEAIKRKWLSGLELKKESNSKNLVVNSNPAAVDRGKYMLNPPSSILIDAVVPVAEPQSEPDDEFADEFEDSEVIHATHVGKKLAESVSSLPEASVLDPQPAIRKLVVKTKEVVNVEELDDSLDDQEYDQILEPSECDVRIFGQTEICESVQGPRRADSRWMVTVLNGFIQTKSGDEYLFRTSNQTMPNLHQHFS